MNQMTGRLHGMGQSLWLDNITRGLLDSGTLQRYIDDLSVTGLTSNPTIFNLAIKNSNFYDTAIADKVRAQLAPAIGRLGVTVLSVTTQVVDRVDDDHATGVVYCTAEIEDPDEGWIRQSIVYQDRYERHDGRWYLKARDHQLVYGICQTDDPLAQPPADWPTRQVGRGIYSPPA